MVEREEGVPRDFPRTKVTKLGDSLDVGDERRQELLDP